MTQRQYSRTELLPTSQFMTSFLCIYIVERAPADQQSFTPLQALDGSVDVF